MFWEKINSNCCGFSYFGDVTYLLTYLLADFRWHLNIVVDRIMLYGIYRLFSTVTSIVSTTWCLNKPIAADRQWSSCCKSRARRCFYKRAAKSESLTDSLLSTRCHHHVSSRHWSEALDRHNPSLYSISVCHISQPTSQFSAWLNEEHFSKKTRLLNFTATKDWKHFRKYRQKGCYSPCRENSEFWCSKVRISCTLMYVITQVGTMILEMNWIHWKQSINQCYNQSISQSVIAT